MKNTILLITIALVSLQTLNAQNLILNPGCEDPLVNNKILFWQETIATNFSQSGPGVNGSTYFFWAGNSPVAELSQIIDISADSLIIDTGIKNYYFNGFVFSATQNADESNIYFYFKDSGNTSLDTFHLGPYITPTWLQINTILVAPIGARKIDLRLHSIRHAGTSNDGYYDDLYLGGTSWSSATIPVVAIQSSDTSFCEKQAIDFTDLSTNNPTSWQWTFTGGTPSTSTLQNPNGIYYNSYGSFDVKLIACNAAGCDTVIYTNFINEFQNPVDSIWQLNGQLISLPGNSYQWYEVTNGIVQGATGIAFQPTAAGNYYCIITDVNGCNGVSNIIYSTEINSIYFENGISVYPNPFTEAIAIDFKKHHINHASLEIKNLIRQTVYKNDKFENKFKENIDLSIIQQGIYFLEVIIDDNIEVTKIIKR